MNYSEIKSKYPNCFKRMNQQDPFLEESDFCPFPILLHFFEDIGLTISLVPIPQKRSIRYTPIVLYCHDTYNIFFIQEEEWKERDYTEQYEPFRYSCYIIEDAKKLAIGKAFELVENDFQMFIGNL